MRSIAEQMQAYSAYHQDSRNKLSHVLGVPLIIFSLFVALGWFRFAAPELLPFPLTGATLFFVGVTIYYAKMDLTLALLEVPFGLALLYAAEQVAKAPFAHSAAIFGLTFVGGWIIQLIGHAFEGRRPAMSDNLLQMFNAPLFLLAEMLFLLGLRRNLQAQVLAQK